MARGGSRSSFGVIQVIGGLAILLAVGVALALILAPEKPPAPPTSEVTYQKASPKPRTEPLDDDFRSLADIAQGRPAPQATPAVAEKSQDESPKEAPYAVSGFVFVASTREPLKDAVIQVQRVWATSEQSDWERRNAEAMRGTDKKLIDDLRNERNRLNANERSRTDAEGRFKVGLENPGRYEIKVSHREYVTSNAPPAVLNDDTPLVETEVGLSTGAVITGRVTEEGSNVPAPELSVQIEDDGIHRGTTDSDGNYRISGLPPGNYGVVVNTRGSAYKPGRRVPYQKVSIRAADQEIRGINFEVEAAGVVWGYVLTPDRQPLSGAEVLNLAPTSIISQALTAAVRETPPVRSRSQDDGYYELLGVPLNQEWRVYASTGAYSPQLSQPFMLTSEVRSVQIDMFLYGGSLVTGVVVDSKGGAVEGARVACLPSYSKMFAPLDSPAAFRETNSAADGTFTIEKLPAGDYQLIAQKRGFKIATMGEPIYPDGASPVNNVRITLLPVDEGDHWVMGRVLDVTQRPISGANVTLAGMGTETFNNFERQVSTDSKGEFRIDGLETGQYRLTAEKEGYAPRTIPRALLDTATTIILDQSATIRGVVLVRETRKAPESQYTVTPLPLASDGEGVNVLAVRQAGGGQTFAAPDGSFQLAVPAGSYRLEGRAEGFTPGREAVSVGAGQVVDGITLFISRAGGTIRGTVTAGGGSPNGATVSLVEISGGGDALGGGRNQQTVGEDGAFTFTQLPEGTYRAFAEHPNYANGTSETVYLAADGNETIQIRLGSGGAIEGTVLANRQPVVGATILAVSAESGSSETTTTDTSGHYYVDNLGTGNYTVTWLPSSGQLGDISSGASATVDVVDGQVSRLDFGGSGARVTGICSPPQASLVPPGQAFLRPAGSPPFISPGGSARPEALERMQGTNRVSVQPDGSFLFEGVSAGIYQIEIYFFSGFGENTEIRNVALMGPIEITGDQEVNIGLVQTVQF